MAWGKSTVVKFIGGEVVFRLEGPQSPQDYAKDLNGMVERSKDLSPAFEAIARYLQGVVMRNFKAEGRPVKWAPLAPSTIADRMRKGYGSGPILQRSGGLMKSLTTPGAPGFSLRVGPRSVAYTSNIFYFRFHQVGTSKMPARPMLVFQKQDHTQVSRILNTYILTGEVTYGGPRG